jgi:protein-L-isoaspartate(D-aspartate) O-methyltransferase
MSRSKPPSPRAFPLPLEQLRGGAAQAPAPAPVRTRVQRPQRLLDAVAAAAADEARRHRPVGLGLDSAAVRARMVDRLRTAGIADERVLAAFARVPRHVFVDSALANQAYEDTSLPIGFAQTISKPSVVAQMLQAALRERPPVRVLEIGTGCGYQAALLASLAQRVVSIERIGGLAQKARANLLASGITNVEVLHGDGRLGAPGQAPFDAIVSAAGGADMPAAWLDQLAVDGRLVAPGQEVRPGVQELVVIERHPHGYTRRMAGEVYFVPLKSGAA